MNKFEFNLSNNIKMSKNVLLSCLCSYLCALSFGFVIGYTSPALPKMQSAGELFHKNDDSATWFGSIATLGGMVGCLLAGWLADKFGRKISIMILLIPFIFGWLGITMGHNINLLYFSRMLNGLASGMVCVVCPLYIAEVVPSDKRGSLGAGIQLSITIGILLVNFFGMYLSWRSLALLCVIPSITCLILSFKIFESPRFLLNKDKRSECVRSLMNFRGSMAIAEEECRDLEENWDEESNKFSLKEFSRPELYRPLIVGIVVMLFQQFTGINIVMFYTVTIFQEAGFGSSGGLASCAVGLTQVFGTLIAVLLMDKTGRRVLLIIASLGMAASCFLLAYYYKYTNTVTTLPSYGYLALFGLMAYILAFALGWGPIPMLLASEIFPPQARGVAIGIVSLVNWFFAFLITKSFSQIKGTLGMDGMFTFFGVSCLAATAYVYQCIPETKGKSLDDIGLYFLGRIIRGI